MDLETKQIDRRTIGLLASGLLLLLAATTGLMLIPQGPSEFGYYPFTPEPLPFASARGFTFEQLCEHGLRILLATPGLLLLSVGLARLVRGQPALTPSSHRRLALAVSLLALCFVAWAMFFLFDGRAIVDDELTYRDQAAVLLEGGLGRAGPPLWFVEPFTISTRVGYTGKYPFGEPLLQIPGLLVGLPGVLHLPLAALTLLLVFYALRPAAGSTVASWTVVLLALSPTFLYTTPTGQSMASSLFLVALAGFGHACIAYRRRPWLGALLLGTAVGFGMTVRPQSMMPMGTVLVAAALIHLWRGRRLAAAGALLLVLAGWAALILLYNEALSGSYLTLPWYLFKPVDRYGFGQVWDFTRYIHTPLTALENLGVMALRFNAWWLGWPSGLLLLWLWLRNGRPLDGALIWLAAGAAVLAFQFPYYSAGGITDTGVYYHYELLLPAAVVGANAVRQGFVTAPRLTVILLVVHFGVGTTEFLWYQGSRLQRLISGIHDAPDAALAQVDKPALLLYDVHCSECTKVGWMLGCFPRRYRARDDAVLTYPRPPGDRATRLIRQFSDRSCWYYRRNPDTGKAELHRCQDARGLIFRPHAVTSDDACLVYRSTAQAMGLYDPWGVIGKNRISRVRQRMKPLSAPER